MVKTSYPAMWRYFNKFSIIFYGLFFFVPLNYNWYIGHFSWKRGKVPRMTHNDQKIQKYIDNSGMRNKLLYSAALEWQQDQNNFMHKKYIRKFVRRHALVWRWEFHFKKIPNKKAISTWWYSRTPKIPIGTLFKHLKHRYLNLYVYTTHYIPIFHFPSQKN